MRPGILHILILTTLAVLLLGCINDQQTEKTQNPATDIDIIITPHPSPEATEGAATPAQTIVEDEIISDDEPNATIPINNTKI